jgi:hypothetical protein
LLPLSRLISSAADFFCRDAAAIGLAVPNIRNRLCSNTASSKAHVKLPAVFCGATLIPEDPVSTHYYNLWKKEQLLRSRYLF